MRLGYYPGCSLKSTAKSFEDSSLSAMAALGIELVELPRWNCCGTVHALAKDDVMHYIAPTRVLVRVEEMNREGDLKDFKLVTPCAMCYNTLKRANTVIRSDLGRMTKLHEIMEKEKKYEGKVEVLHLLELIKNIGFKKINKNLKIPLKGLKIASYYGCLLVRPRSVSIDNPDNPQVMENLVSALGGEIVEIPYKTRCCGSYHTVARKDIVAQAAYEILKQAEAFGAELVSVACPLCSFNLDENQEEVKKKYSDFKKIPVVYFTQLMALALGIEESLCGFQENFIDPKPVLLSKGLI